MVVDCQTNAPVAFTPRKYSWYSFLLEADATVCRYLFTAKSLYVFRVSQHPSSGVLKTVTAVNKYLHTAESGWIFINIFSFPAN